MSRSVNKVILLGNVGQDPEVRAAQSGALVAKWSLATNQKWTGRDGQTQERTDWHRLTAFGKLAEVVERYVRKGDKLYVEGRVQYSTTTDEGGNTRYWTDVVVDQLVMLGSSNGGGQAEERGGYTNTPDQYRPAPATTPAPAPQLPLSEPEDDLPF